MRSLITRRCVRWGVAGCVLGFTVVAYAQDPAADVVISTPEGVARAVGLPTVLAYIAHRMAASVERAVQLGDRLVDLAERGVGINLNVKEDDQ